MSASSLQAPGEPLPVLLPTNQECRPWWLNPLNRDVSVHSLWDGSCSHGLDRPPLATVVLQSQQTLVWRRNHTALCFGAFTTATLYGSTGATLYLQCTEGMWHMQWIIIIQESAKIVTRGMCDLVGWAWASVRRLLSVRVLTEGSTTSSHRIWHKSTHYRNCRSD